MQPIYPYVQVEPIENNSALALTVDQTPVVKVVRIPSCPVDDTSLFNNHINAGSKILTNHVDEYVVDGKKVFFTRLKDIVSIV